MQKIFTLLFILLANFTLAQIPTTQDCLGAISICTETYVETNSPSGSGNYSNEINGTSQGGICCMDNELNSIWYTFTVDQSGDFGFTLTPNNASDDYDWALFNITDASCSDIFNDPSLQVSCNAAGGSNCHGPTGANGLSNFNNQGAGCNALSPNQFQGFSPNNALVPVEFGNTYALCVSNWTGSTFGYTIDFGVSSNIGIIDNIPPFITDVITPGDCGGGEFEVTFSENIQCNSISGNNFEIDGPGGPYTAVVNSVICSQGGEYDNVFTVMVDPPILDIGNYAISLTGDFQTEVLDLCENPSTVGAATFEVLSTPLANLNLGNDTILCEGQVLTIDGSIPNALNYEWQDGTNNSTYIITEPGTYQLMATNDCNTLVDEISVNFVPLQTIEVDLGNDTILCPGDLYELDATWIGGIEYIWQDGFNNPIYTVSEAGIYQVEILGACGEMGSAIVEVTYDDTQLNLDLGRDSLLCEEDGIYILDASDINALAYTWSDGSTTPYLQTSENGNYAVTISDNCNVLTDEINLEFTNCTICEVYVPNAFSPDFDGFNDNFRPFSNCVLENFSMKIFNRWGALVYESDESESGWDGKFNNKGVDEGVYIYLMEFQVNQMGELLDKKFSGDITVIK